MGVSIKAMRAAGISTELIVKTLAIMEEEKKALHRSAQAKYRKNKRIGDEGDVTDITAITTLSYRDSNLTSNNSKVLDSSDSTRESEFAQFWAACPHKIGKGAARKKFWIARKKVSLKTLIDALERYKQQKPSDLHWCNPATWLHQERWDDVRAAPPEPVQRKSATVAYNEEMLRRCRSGNGNGGSGLRDQSGEVLTGELWEPAARSRTVPGTTGEDVHRPTQALIAKTSEPDRRDHD